MMNTLRVFVACMILSLVATAAPSPRPQVTQMAAQTQVFDGGPLPLCDPRYPEGRYCRGKAVAPIADEVSPLPKWAPGMDNSPIEPQLKLADGSDPMPLCRTNCPKLPTCRAGQVCTLRGDRPDLGAGMTLAALQVPRGCRYVYTCHHYTPDGTAYCAWELWCGA